MGDAVLKVCTKCALDVSGLKRHKDAQGRYWCEACFAQAAAKQTAQGTKAPPPGSAAETTPAWLAGSLAIEGKRCEQCSAAIPKDAVVCNMCGFNTTTGKAIKTAVVMAPKEKPPRVKGPGIGFDPAMLAFVFGGLCLALLVGGTMNTGCAVAFLVVAYVGGFAIWIWMLIAIAMQSVTKAILGFLCGLYALLWVFTQCESPTLQRWVLVWILVSILTTLAHFGIVPLHGIEGLSGAGGSAMLDRLPHGEPTQALA